eukprot:TRINITY_DN5657_c0_g1_i7.p2 TRINITY_DN5657_c0_g1~~TRINITY_DN5657_c0_g1_i7.p2  ORF type:complete len:111 (-),score=4.80 TRINITY_DN5657_c0_g1_i7:466-798(-)
MNTSGRNQMKNIYNTVQKQKITGASITVFGTDIVVLIILLIIMMQMEFKIQKSVQNIEKSRQNYYYCKTSFIFFKRTFRENGYHERWKNQKLLYCNTGCKSSVIYRKSVR